jgi:internalin A
MKRLIKSLAWSLLLVLAATTRSAEPEQRLFPDKNLEAAVRKFVFEKRDNDKPLTEADLANLSTIQAVGMGITNLGGLEKCQSLASLDLSKNKVVDLKPLKNLSRIQYLNLADNQIEDLSPLRGLAGLQYVELSRNRVKDLQPLASLTNLASLYLSSNQISGVAPVTRLPRLVSLYLDHNKISNIEGIGMLKNLSTLSLNNNSVSTIAPLDGLTGLYFLFLENNKLRDLGPLVQMVKKDNEGEKRFAPFLNLYIKGNPLSAAAKRTQVTALKESGAKVDY